MVKVFDQIEVSFARIASTITIAIATAWPYSNIKVMVHTDMCTSACGKHGNCILLWHTALAATSIWVSRDYETLDQTVPGRHIANPEDERQNADGTVERLVGAVIQ